MDAGTKQPRTNWFRPLKGGRLEVSLRYGDLRLRASGSEDWVWALVAEFENLTGVGVVGDWVRPLRTGPRMLAGQLALDQLSLADGDGEE